MRIAGYCLLLMFLIGTATYTTAQQGPLVCVSAKADDTGKTIGPLGDLNGELASQIAHDHKPLRAAGLPSGITGRTSPPDECDYLLEITLHVGGTAIIPVNPTTTAPLNPPQDPRLNSSKWIVRSMYRLTSLPKASKKINFKDDIVHDYDPNVIGYQRDLPTIAKRIAETSANSAASKLKKKLKL